MILINSLISINCVPYSNTHEILLKGTLKNEGFQFQSELFADPDDNALISLVVINVIFGGIFKVLSDVKINWRDVGSCTIFTAILFLLGKLVIGFMLAKANYGAVWAYCYSRMGLLYLNFEGEFTKAYADLRIRVLDQKTMQHMWNKRRRKKFGCSAGNKISRRKATAVN